MSRRGQQVIKEGRVSAPCAVFFRTTLLGPAANPGTSSRRAVRCRHLRSRARSRLGVFGILAQRAKVDVTVFAGGERFQSIRRRVARCGTPLPEAGIEVLEAYYEMRLKCLER